MKIRLLLDGFTDDWCDAVHFIFDSAEWAKKDETDDDVYTIAKEAAEHIKCLIYCDAIQASIIEE